MFGYLTIALIVAAVGNGLYLVLMLVVASSERINPIKGPYAEGEDAEHAVLRLWLQFPHAWLDVVDDVWQLFPGKPKGNLEEQRFLEHINAVDPGQPLGYEEQYAKRVATRATKTR